MVAGDGDVLRLLRAGTTAEHEHVERTLDLLDPHLDRTRLTVVLPAGSTVLLYTDGLVERRDQPFDDGSTRSARRWRTCGGCPSRRCATCCSADCCRSGRWTTSRWSPCACGSPEPLLVEIGRGEPRRQAVVLGVAVPR